MVTDYSWGTLSPTGQHWNSNFGDNAWVVYDLGSLHRMSTLSLVPDMLPLSCDVQHEVSLGPTAALVSLFTTYTGYAAKLQPIVLDVSTAPPFRFVKIRTTQSCSVAAWFGVCGTVSAVSEPMVVQQVVAGGSSSCALLDDGSVRCWGVGDHGESGYGDRLTRWAPPVEAVQVGGAVTRLAAGVGATCAIRSVGDLVCWGSGTGGRLGYGNTADVLSPYNHVVDVGGDGVFDVGLGTCFTCALLRGGSVKCWGCNLDGQLGLGDTVDRVTPTVPVQLGSGVSVEAMAVGGSSVCVLVSPGGVVKCWGSNVRGQLGTGDTTPRLSPPDQHVVFGEAGSDVVVVITALAAGDVHVCALMGQRGMVCWGGNDKGQLGLGDTADRWAPSSSPLLVGGTVTSMALGARYTCGLSDAGEAYCWGDSIGFGGPYDTNTPSMDALLFKHPLASLAAGGDHLCGLLVTGSVGCVGNGMAGQLGTGYAANLASPPDVGVYFPSPVWTTQCYQVPEGTSASLSCVGGTFAGALVASYGTVSGSCPDFQLGDCSSRNSMAAVNAACAGRSTCTVSASVWFIGDDPCPMVLKSLNILIAGDCTLISPSSTPTVSLSPTPSVTPSPSTTHAPYRQDLPWAWSQFQRDASHTGVSSFFGPKQGVTVRWTSGVNATQGAVTYASVVLGTSYRVFFANSDGTVFAVDQGTGELVWETALGAPVLAGLALDLSGTVYVATHNGPLVALDPWTGEVVWSYPGGFFLGAPVTDGGLVYAGAANGTLHAVRATDGSRVWSYDTFVTDASGHSIHAAIACSPTLLVDGTLYFTVRGVCAFLGCLCV